MIALKKCLQCDEDYYAVKAQKLPCEIWGGYEYYECEEQWTNHRWADWKDSELAHHGVHADAYEKHRRTNVLTLPYTPCEETIHGHTPATTFGDQLYAGVSLGTCIDCGKKPDEQ